jgi:hypothetical protein
MCCFVSAILFVGPRLGILVWWIANPVYINRVFQTWIWPLLGFIFLPWSTLAYLAIAPGGVIGFDWIIFGLGVFADMASYFGGYYNRKSVPYSDQVPYMD